MQRPIEVEFTPNESHLLLSFEASIEELVATVRAVMSVSLPLIEKQIVHREPTLRLNRYGAEMSLSHNVVLLSIPMMREHL